MKYILCLLVFALFIHAEPATKNDIKLVLEQMDKRFTLMQYNMDKRFEQVDKRFDTIFSILYILMGLIFASPFIVIYLRDKKDAEDKKNFDALQGILFTLRGFAQENEKIAKSLKAANLL